jgi:hypothetical protein
MVSKEVIILLVIIGCVVSVLLGYAIHYLSTNGFNGHNQTKDMAQEQRQYMRGVRMRQLGWMMRDLKYGGGGYGR